MPQSECNNAPARAGASPVVDPTCEMARLYPGHVCRDRDGDPLSGSGKACHLGARVRVLRARRPDIVESAYEIVRSFEAWAIGGQAS